MVLKGKKKRRRHSDGRGYVACRVRARHHREDCALLLPQRRRSCPLPLLGTAYVREQAKTRAAEASRSVVAVDLARKDLSAETTMTNAAPPSTAPSGKTGKPAAPARYPAYGAAIAAKGRQCCASVRRV